MSGRTPHRIDRAARVARDCLPPNMYSLNITAKRGVVVKELHDFIECAIGVRVGQDELDAIQQPADSGRRARRTG